MMSRSLLVAMLSTIVTVGCTSHSIQTYDNPAAQTIPAQPSVFVAPPQVIVSLRTAGGIYEPSAEHSTKGAEDSKTAMFELLEHRKVNAFGHLQPEVSPKVGAAIEKAYQALGVLREKRTAHFPLAVPTETLDELTRLSNKKAHYAILFWGNGSTITTGKAVAEGLKSAPASMNAGAVAAINPALGALMALGAMSRQDTSDEGQAFAILVDLRDGAVKWSSFSKGNESMSDWKDWTTAILADIPL